MNIHKHRSPQQVRTVIQSLIEEMERHGFYRIYLAEVFPPGEYLRDELDERGWTITEFAEIIGRPIQAVSEILNGKKEITTETALAFADALGTTPSLWLNLQTNYRLWTERQDRQTEAPAVARTPVHRPRHGVEGA